MTSKTQRTYSIERFYFGNLIQNGEPIAKPGVLAHSRGVTSAHVQACLQAARVKPPSLAETNPDMPGALGFFRVGKGYDVVVKSQRTAEGQPQLLYLLVPEEGLQWLGGNYALFAGLAYEDMPTYESHQRNLKPLLLEDPHPLADEEQIELLYDLFYYAADKVKNIEGMLAALIHHKPLALLNAPPNLAERMGFIHGLLGLLPAPARIGITWVTCADLSSSPAQISFMSQSPSAEDYVIYDWAAGALLNTPPADKYSKFITSQLRLDPQVVIETTTSIAKTAVWRAMRKESLAQALLFASRRAAIDSAVSNNQPADRETVAAILRQDPTLTDDMRVLYARHLLAFTLALGDELQNADVLPAVAAANRPVAEALYQQLRWEADNSNAPWHVFELIERWLLQVPQAKVIPWHQIAYIAALNEIRYLLHDNEIAEITHLLGLLREADPALQIEAIAGQILATAQPAAVNDPELARAAFLLATEYLSLSAVQQFIADAQVVGQLPPKLREVLSHLQPQPNPNPAPKGLLISAVSDLPSSQRPLVIGRMVELAIALQRDHLIESRVLEALFRAAQAGYANRFYELIRYLTDRYSKIDKLRELERSTLILLPHLYFSTSRYEAGVLLLDTYQYELFTLKRLDAFGEMMAQIFSQARYPIETLESIFGVIEHSRIRIEARARAYCAILITGEWGAAYKTLAQRLTVMLYNEPALVELIGMDNTLSLLNFHAEARDAISVTEIGQVLLEKSLLMGGKGADLMLRVGESISRVPEIDEARLNLYRLYVRYTDADIAAQVPAYYAKKLKPELGPILSATYLMRQILNERDLLTFTQAILLTSELLRDIAITYHSSKEPPPKHRLRRELDSLTGGLAPQDWQIIGQNMERIARTVYVLGQQHVRRKQNAEYEAALRRNQVVPRTGLDFLLFLGGYFANQKIARLDIERESMSHVFGNRSALLLLEESGAMSALLDDLVTVFPPNKPPTIQLGALLAEIDSLWGTLSLYDQRRAEPILSANTQYIAQFIPMMAAKNRDGLFKNQALISGGDKPENELEALIWVSGYFLRAHQP